MSLRPPPIDYAAVRQAVLAAVRDCTGLDANHTIVAEPEQPNWPRPSRPYITYKLTSPAVFVGWDELTPKNPAQTPDDFVVTGPRAAVASLQSYGNTHEDAYSLLALVQAGLQSPDVLGSLRLAGIAVWSVGAVTDLSSLLLTGFEGRAAMEVRLGLVSRLTRTVGSIAHVNLGGVLQTETATVVINEEL